MIGYYAHGQGSGHCNYANIFGRVFVDDLIVYTDRGFIFTPGTRVVHLPDEHTDGTEYNRELFPEPSSLHYAPINLKKITVRNRMILESIIDDKVDFIIVDVSVEVAMLARISSVPYAYVRLLGTRNDLGHIGAYEGATFLLAYFPPEFESLDTPQWVRQKTIYLGFLSDFSFQNDPIPKPTEYYNVSKPILLKVNGFGGSTTIDFKGLEGKFAIFSVGPKTISGTGTVHEIGIVPSIRAYLYHSDIIIASCGLNITSEILSLRRGFIALPEKRHFGEQQQMAVRLQELNLGVDASGCSSIASAVSMLNNNTADFGRLSIGNNKLLEFYGHAVGLGYRCDLIREKYGAFPSPNIANG